VHEHVLVHEPAGHPTAYNAAMLARALIVLLLVLNLGVATWWATRQPPPPSVLAPPPGVARLQLLSEAPRKAVATPAATPPAMATPAATTKASTPMQCFSFGPFVDAATAATARARLRPLAMRIATREQSATTAHGWRVQMPPLASPEAAQAMAQRIAAADFSDFLIVRDGTEANAIALGRYGGEDSARRRADALVAAGFDARAEPLDDTKATTWLDVVAATGFNAAAAQVAAAAPQRRPLDCARLQ
jgi:hypothetical protein